MKKLFTFIALLLLAVTLLGQAPAGFKYQAVLRDARGNIKANVTANIKIDILQGSSSGSIVYSENHFVTTNMYGLINLEIGNGTPTKSTFSTIDWGTSTYFVKIFVDGVEMGTDQLMSVPYALNAKTAEKVTGKLIELDPVFLASPAMGITSGNLANWNTAFSWDNHAAAGYLKASLNDQANWNSAFGWGNHASAGYLKNYTETDPTFLASPAGGITPTNITNWNSAVKWGDHALAGYLKSNSENDPIFKASPAIGITSNNISNWNTAFGWGNHATAGYLKSITETDPVFLASPARGISTNNITDWNKAVAWGDHASAGYLKINSENDPIFKAWDKSTGISILSSQVRDFESSVTNNSAVQSNTAKNSYPATDKLKLARIQDSAEVNVNADWNATSGDAQILNKPTIPFGTKPGDMQYWNGTAWVLIPAGLPGQYLQYTTANIPAWSGAAYISLTTSSATSITDSTAISGGIISDAGGEATERGVCWNTTQNPSITDSKTNSGPGSGSFVSSITRLTALTTYYVRAYATNSLGTQYGAQVSFTTPVKPIRKQKITGHVQKGPFVNGTTILMAELSSTMQQTGRNFNTQISNNSGSFEIANVVLTSSFVEFSANGYYYDEVKGSLSVAPLNLYALSDITDLTTVNVNILTHLEKQRVDYLITQNKTFAEAKKTAQAEIMAIFGITLSGMSSSETLDISASSEGNAILLAISIMLQGNRSVGDLTELLANINNDIRTDGKMDSQSIMTSLRNSTKELVLPTIRTNLENRYQTLGINATIPDFEKYIWKFLEFTGLKPLVTTQAATNTTAISTTLNGLVNANSLSTTAVFEYGTTTSYGSTATATQSPVTGHSELTIGADLASLLPNTTYHFRVKTENSQGITFGNDATFTTRDGVVALSTTSISVILTTSSASGGNITNDGGAAVTTRGVCWSIAQNPTTADSKTTDGTGMGSFASAITGLTPGAVYYVRAYGTNTVGTVYGNQLSFTALGLVPAAATVAASSITTTSATLNGTANANHLSTVVTFEYGSTVEYGSTATATQSPVTGSDANNVTSEISGLLQGTLYHFRIKTVNELGTTYGSDLTFTTHTIPSLTSNVISSITSTSATSGGEISSDGGTSVTVRGVCWSTTAVPTIADSKTSDGTGTGLFTSNLSSLIGNTIYYLRAYATNSVGTNYGNEVSFKTSPVLPVVTTTAISDTTQTTATSGGNVTYDGGAEITTRGICWSTSASPTTINSKTTDGTGTGTFISNLTVLTGNTLYYVRAYATNSVGTEYGNEITFKTTPVLPLLTTTSISEITQTTATSGGNVTDNGGTGISTRGVCWSTSSNPSTADTKTTDGTGSGSFSSNITGLSGNTTYYMRAFAINKIGTNYGNEVSFKTSPVLPIVTTTAISDTTQTTATLGGNVTYDGGSEITVRGICWSTSASPTIADSKTSDGTGTSIFSSNLTVLTGNTIYYVRAYATNSVGTEYGNEITFKTTPVLATITTTAITAITQTSATSGGAIASDGGGTITARGVCWSTSTNPTTAGSKTTDGTGTDAFASNLTSLTGNTTYYVRAYATNRAGTKYGNEVSFTTSPVLPAVTTTVITAINSTTSSSGGNATNDGGSIITERGVCWSTSSNPTTADKKATNGSGTGVFTVNLSSLTGLTTYYVRAYAINSVGTAYGTENTFTTLGGGIITDSRDSHAYKWVIIGTQSWMAENLAYLPSVSPSSIGSQTDQIYYVHSYEGNSVSEAKTSANYSTYGVLYNWEAAKTGCPSGWHLPSNVDWNILWNYLGSLGPCDSNGGGGKIKEIGTEHWLSPNTGATNSSGFTALPGDSRGNGGRFGTLGYGSSFWSTNTDNTSTAHIWKTQYNMNGFCWGGNADRSSGYQVRCVKGNLATVTTAEIIEIRETSASSGGNITNDDGINITERGICWSSSANPTTANFKTKVGADSPFNSGTFPGPFNASLTGLIGNTTYFVKAYVICNAITIYGNQVSFITSPGLPVVTTTAVSNISETTASSGGNIINNGGTSIQASGVCWSTSHNPTITNSKTTDGTGIGIFTSSMSGLNANVTYYVRAYATNEFGTSYGEEVLFSILQGNSGSFPDPRDGKVYKWVKIDNHIWMAENLAYLPAVSPSSVGSDNQPNYYVYGYEGTNITAAKATSNYATYGVLYNRSATMNGESNSDANPSGVKGVCPSGWHLPSTAEWTTLSDYLGPTAGKKMKSTSSWTGNGNGDNSSGLTILASGYRNYASYFYQAGIVTFIWSASKDRTYPEAANITLWYTQDAVSFDRGSNANGFSVRCVKD